MTSATPRRTHRAPAATDHLVRCCGRPVRDVLSEDLSADPAAVTCDGTYSVSQGATRLTVGRLLEFERDHPRPCSAKDEDIRRLLGTTPSHYYVLLGRAIDTDDAAALDPILTRRLREQRDRRLAARAARATVRPRPAASL